MRLELRQLGESDAPAVLAYFLRNAEFRAPWAPSPPADFFSEEHQRQRLASDAEAAAAGRAFRFWLVPRTAAAGVIGMVAANNIVRGAFQSCHLGYEIDGRFGGQGLMPEAVCTVADWLLGELGLHRIEANIMPRNQRSIRVAQKAGFLWEGRSPRYLRINGVWEDHDHYVRLGDG
jgi:ribosomal-protein-alanine N-acetyltransferase